MVAGSNITLVPDNVNKKVTIHSTGGGGGSSTGDMLRSVYDQDLNGIVDKAETLDDGTDSLTATIAELNYVDGVTSAIQTQLNGKAAAIHTHTTSDITDLSIPDDLADLNDDSTHRLVTDTEKTTWNGKQDALTAGTGISIDSSTNTISATAPSIKGYKRVKVGSTNIDASASEDTIEFIASTGMTITPDATNKTITFISSGGGGTSTGDMLKIVYDQNNNGIVDKAETLNDGTTALTTSITELNYVDGVTSAIQTQIDGKAAASHTHVKTDITDFPTIPTALTQLDTTGSSTCRVVTDAEKTTWNNKQNAITWGAGITIDPNTGAVTASGVQSDWNEADNTAADYIKNKPTIPAAQIQSDWNQSDNTKLDYIKNKPAVLGHNMLNNSTIITGINASISEGVTNDDVVSGYGIGVWSNTDTNILLSAVAQDDTEMGTWEDDSTWQTGSRVGWLIHEALFKVLDVNSGIDIEPVFEMQAGSNDAISCLMYRIDDEMYQSKIPVSNPKAEGLYESNGQTPPTYTLTNDETIVSGKTYYVGVGAGAIKFNAPIPTTNVQVGFKLTKLRTNVFRSIVRSS